MLSLFCHYYCIYFAFVSISLHCIFLLMSMVMLVIVIIVTTSICSTMLQLSNETLYAGALPAEHTSVLPIICSYCFPFTSTHFHHLLRLCLHRSCATSIAGASLIYQLAHLFSCHLLPRALIAVAALPALPTHDLLGSNLLLVTLNSHLILLLSPTRL